ncbi:Uncharacterised protein [Moraxella caprae]|uniref:Uncharacterized protein n=1 Tax=Moraxella caprae TaxID=90240 RepID=A0A378R1E1_9GAMM|nr:hypothetical protein [Moraxella caprae]STZ08599.1 Uncharacterised protein [Moraxella caprae]
MTTVRKDFSRQGAIYLAETLGDGKRGDARWIGDTGTVSLSINEEQEVRKDNYTGQRATSVVVRTGLEISIEMNIRYADAENLALGLHGKTKTIAGGSVTDEVFPQTEAGRVILLEHGAISSLVISDNGGKTLSENTHYRIRSDKGGVIEILDLASFTQPLKANYTYGGSKNLSVLTVKPKPVYLLMDSINTVDNSRERLHLYKVEFAPLANLGLIDESLGEITLQGKCLLDSVYQQDPDLGGYGKIELLD